MAPPPADAVARRRPRHRRQRILDAAIELFGERGYHAAGIDDIGAAAGITGPGVYRHFPSKLDMLVAVFERTADDRAHAAAAIVAAHDEPAEALAALVEDHVRFAVEYRSVIAVYLQEGRNLPQPQARRIRRRQRVYLDSWVALLAPLRPELDADAALATVQAAIGVIHSVAFYDSALDRERLIRLLAEGAFGVLAAPGAQGPPLRLRSGTRAGASP